MKQRKWLLSEVLVILLCITFSSARAQLHQNYINEFLSTQWWLGVKLGTSLTAVNPIARFSGISPLNFENNTLDKAYDDFNLIGVNAGLDITFYHKGFSIGIQPNFRRSRYSYQNDFFWEGDSPNERFETTIEQEQKIDFFDLPVFVKYDLLKSSLRPYLMGGGYISFVTSAEKSIEVTQIDFSSGTGQSIDAGNLVLGVTDNFARLDYGVMAGLGLSYDFWNVRGILEGSYRLGLANITEETNRFVETQLVSIGDVNDDVELRSINISISLVFPLRFISKQFQAY